MEEVNVKLPEMVVGKSGKYTQYYRSFNPSQEKVTSLLSKCYDGKYSIILPSGTAAISATLHTLLIDLQTKELNIVYGNELYTDTPKVIKQMESYVKCNLYQVVIQKNEEIKKFFSKLDSKIPTILFIESCTNPTGYIPDYQFLLKEINLMKKKGKFITIVDNTYISSAVFNPFDIGADIVVLSLTKYYSGGNCIAGSVISNEDFGNKIQNWTKLNGLHVSPINCEIISENIIKMKERTEKTRKITKELAIYCEKKGYIVSYVGLKSHENYERCLKYFKTEEPNSTFTIQFELKKEDLFKLLESCNFDVLTSFGSKNSFFDSWPKKVKKSTSIRFSVGYEDSIDQILPKFDKVFDKMKKLKK